MLEFRLRSVMSSVACLKMSCSLDNPIAIALLLNLSTIRKMRVHYFSISVSCLTCQSVLLEIGPSQFLLSFIHYGINTIATSVERSAFSTNQRPPLKFYPHLVNSAILDTAQSLSTLPGYEFLLLRACGSIMILGRSLPPLAPANIDPVIVHNC